MAANDAQGDAVMAEAAAHDAEIANNSSSSSASNGGVCFVTANDDHVDYASL